MGERTRETYRQPARGRDRADGHAPDGGGNAGEGKAAVGVPESKEIRLSLPTFTATAEMAAISRLWGGYHIRTDNEAGLGVRRKVADYSWAKYEALFNGL